MSTFPDWQQIQQWTGDPLAGKTALALGGGVEDTGPLPVGSWASIILWVKATAQPVAIVVTQTVSGGSSALSIVTTINVPAGGKLTQSIVMFGDTVEVVFTGGGVGCILDYAVVPSNTTSNAQVLTNATINVQKNEVLVALEPTLDFVDSNQNLWSVTDDAANTRVKLALLSGLPSAFVTHSAAQPQANNGGGTGHLLGLAFDTETWDTDGFHDPVTNNSRITIPAGLAGKYVALGSSAWTNLTSTAGIRQTGWRKNGADLPGQLNILAGTAGGGNEIDTQSMGFFNLAVGDYLEYGVYQNSGVAINILSGASLGVVRIGP